MDAKKPAKSHAASRKVTILDGLSGIEQAAIAKEYEERTRRPFQCQPCLETGRSHSLRPEAEADEPGSVVVAIVEESGQAIPVCEDCYRRIRDETEAGQRVGITPRRHQTR